MNILRIYFCLPYVVLFMPLQTRTSPNIFSFAPKKQTLLVKRKHLYQTQTETFHFANPLKRTHTHSLPQTFTRSAKLALFFRRRRVSQKQTIQNQ